MIFNILINFAVAVILRVSLDHYLTGWLSFAIASVAFLIMLSLDQIAYLLDRIDDTQKDLLDFKRAEIRMYKNEAYRKTLDL